MAIEEQRRTMVVTRVVAGALSMTEEAAALLGLSERSVWRLKRCFLADGAAGLVHGNRGRQPARRLDDAARARIFELAGGRFEGANDSHLVDLLAEEGLVIRRATVQRILRAAGRPSPRHRPPRRHRSRRDRMPQAGLLVQLDGSRHDWLQSRARRLTLVDAVDHATGILTGTTSASRRTSPATSRFERAICDDAAGISRRPGAERLERKGTGRAIRSKGWLSKRESSMRSMGVCALGANADRAYKSPDACVGSTQESTAHDLLGSSLSREARDDGPSRWALVPEARRHPRSADNGSGRPGRMAVIAISTRLSTPSLFLMCAKCALAVFSEGRTKTGNVVSSQSPRARRQLSYNLRPSPQGMRRHWSRSGPPRSGACDWPEPRLRGNHDRSEPRPFYGRATGAASQRHAQPKQPERDCERAGQDGRPGYHQRPAPLLELPDATPAGCQPEDLEQRHHYHHHRR